MQIQCYMSLSHELFICMQQHVGHVNILNQCQAEALSWTSSVESRVNVSCWKRIIKTNCTQPMLKPASLDSWGEENSPTQAERRPFTLSYSHLTNFDSRTPTANALTTDADFFQFNHKCVRTKNPEFYHRTYVFTVTPQVTQLLHSVKKSNLLAYFLWKKKKVLLSTLFHLVFFSVLIL